MSIALVNLLVLLEVADRLSLKGELEVAREIQLAMLPTGTYTAADAEICGVTRPANTVGGDFYDVLPLIDDPEQRVIITIGDVAGKGSPAALLMALLLAVLRTLVDEKLEARALVARLNTQICRHSPSSRFITRFYGVDEYNIEIAGGLGAFKGKVWRIGLMGYSSQRQNVVLSLAALERLLR